MAQLDFFLCNEERLSFFEFCFERGCKLVPNLDYDSKEYIEIGTIKELEVYNSCTMFFIINPLYNQFPLEFGTFNRDGVTKFYIRQRYGGPSIDFLSPVLAEIEDGKIGSGFLGIYPYYYNGKERFQPNDLFKKIYADFVKFIKKRSKRVKLTKRTYWVGDQTINKVDDGQFEVVDVSGINVVDALSR